MAILREATFHRVLHRTKDNREIRLQVRSATSADVEGLAQHLSFVSRDGEGQRARILEFEIDREELRRSICRFQESESELLLIVVVLDDSNAKSKVKRTIIGHLDFKVSDCEKQSGYFGMAVSPGWRDLGIGRRLLETLISYVKSETSLKQIDLKVLKDNKRAISLYKSLGFSETKESSYASDESDQRSDRASREEKSQLSMSLFV